MAVEAENPVLPSKDCPIATVESSRMSSKCGAGCQTDNEDVQEKTPVLYEFRCIARSAWVLKNWSECRPLGSATEGSFAWQYCREPRSNQSRIIVWIPTGGCGNSPFQETSS